MVVYCILSPGDIDPALPPNPLDTVWQYFRISKVFSNSGGAYLNASKDSGAYTTALDVKLERVSGKIVLETITLYPVFTKTKVPGIFPNQKQLLYVTYKPIKNLSEYHLSITNPKTGANITSKTVTIDRFDIDEAFLHETYVSWFAGLPVQPSWKSCRNGRIYQVTLRFHYAEKSSNSTTFVQKYFDWDLSPQYSNGILGLEPMQTDKLSPVDFYSQVIKNIKEEAGVDRKAGMIEFIFTVGNQEFSDYMDVNKPSDGIVQDKPIYTNINGGIGLFASRISHSVSKSMESRSLDSLFNGRMTSNLGFH